MHLFNIYILFFCIYYIHFITYKKITFYKYTFINILNHYPFCRNSIHLFICPFIFSFIYLFIMFVCAFWSFLLSILQIIFFFYVYFVSRI